MRVLGGLVFAGLVLVAQSSTARADYWQTASDGYRYYWCDADQTWYYPEGNDWLVDDEGVWVASGYCTAGDGYCYYYANRDYRGWRKGRDGVWHFHHHVSKAHQGRNGLQGRNLTANRGQSGRSMSGNQSSGRQVQGGNRSTGGNRGGGGRRR